jgi:hypothetical protein
MRSSMILAMLLWALPAFGGGVLDFLGQADLPPGVMSGTLTAVGVVNDPTPLTTPLPLDFDNHTYTICIQGAVMTSASPILQTYSGGTVALVEDASNSSDYTDPSGFCNGTVILSGYIDGLQRTRLLPTLYNVAGSVTWDGGTRLGEIALVERSGWGLFCTGNPSSPHAANMDEVWDGKIERDGGVPTQSSSFGAVKALFP